MKIAYYPAGPRATASSRLRVWKIADVLEKLGHEVTVNKSPFSADVLIVQKRTDAELYMQMCRERGIKVILDVDDWLPEMQYMAQFADIVTVDTAAKLQLFPGATVIPDALDIDEGVETAPYHDDELKWIVWYGNSENEYHARHVQVACHKLDLEFFAITGSKWGLSTVDRMIIDYDLVVCPYRYDGPQSAEWINSKSANRILKAWALGMPVAGTPIPSYVDAGLQYCATSVDEWVAALEALRDPAAREADAERGRVIASAFTADKVAEQWLEVFQR